MLFVEQHRITFFFFFFFFFEGGGGENNGENKGLRKKSKEREKRLQNLVFLYCQLWIYRVYSINRPGAYLILAP